MGRVAGHRGRNGELTIRVHGDDAGLWAAVGRLRLVSPRGGRGRFYIVERARAYRDRLVVKLRGLDDANAAAQLRGSQVFVAADEAAVLPEGVHYCDRLIGLRVTDESGRLLGRVCGVLPTGGTDILRVTRESDPDAEGQDEELLIPLARQYVLRVAEDQGRIDVRLPDGLEELNRSDR